MSVVQSDAQLGASPDALLEASPDAQLGASPYSAPSFDEIGVSRPVISALARRNIDRPFHIQALVMADALAGRDILGRSPTGSGKTLAFSIPLVERLSAGCARPSALVLVPTRELASQVTGELIEIAGAKGFKVATVYGGVGLPDQARRASRAEIIVATPGRLEDLVTRRMLNIDQVRFLVLDEADRMLDMGFQPQVAKIVRRLPSDRQTMFFSATLDGEVGRLAKAYTRDPALHEVASPKETVDDVDHRFVPVTSGEKIKVLTQLLSSEPGRALVFMRTKRGADRLATKLKTSGIGAVAMHGDMTQSARERSLARFETGRADVLVATDVAARGIDVDDVTHVINFDPPEDHKAYIHRVGRTARAGRSGIGVTLVLPEQEGDVSRMATRLNLKTEFIEHGMKIRPTGLAFTSGRGRKGGGMRPRRRRML